MHAGQQQASLRGGRDHHREIGSDRPAVQGLPVATDLRELRNWTNQLSGECSNSMT